MREQLVSTLQGVVAPTLVANVVVGRVTAREVLVDSAPGSRCAENGTNDRIDPS